jgi:hypothetical protein
MASFWKFWRLVEDSRAGTKSGLYPLGYDGIGNYPPAYLIPTAADALYYLDIDDRLFAWNEGPPWDITHLPNEDDVIPHRDHGMGDKEIKPSRDIKMPGKPKPPEGKMPPGEVVRPKQWHKLVTHPKLLDPKARPNSSLSSEW